AAGLRRGARLRDAAERRPAAVRDSRDGARHAARAVPEATEHRRRDAAGRHRRPGRDTHRAAVRRAAPAGAVRRRDAARPRAAGARRADRGDGRLGAPGVLGRDAGVGRRGAHGAVRHALPGRGGRLRRPDRPAAPRQGRRRRADDRDQGTGRWTHDPGDAARRRRRRDRRPGRSARREPGRSPRRHDRAALRRQRRGPAGAARSRPDRPRPGDHRSWSGGRVPRPHHRPADHSAGPHRPEGDRPMNPALLTARYTRFEVGRIWRNPRFLIFSVVLPVIMFSAFTATDPTDTLGPITVGPYIMISMASFDAMQSGVNIATRIALQRAGGWSRQLRLTALTGPQYLLCKVLGGFTLALPALVAVFVEAIALGRAHLSAGTYLTAGIWVLIGMVPLAALGILLGYVVRADNAGQLIGSMTSLLALAGGIWVPVENFPRWLA